MYYMKVIKVEYIDLQKRSFIIKKKNTYTVTKLFEYLSLKIFLQSYGKVFFFFNLSLYFLRKIPFIYFFLKLNSVLFAINYR